MFKEKLILYSSLENRRERAFLIYCEANVTLILKPHSTTKKKENYRSVSFMNIDVRILTMYLLINSTTYEELYTLTN
jgi:hypothetical protein